MYQYSNGKQLLELCQSQQKNIDEIALLAEVESSGNDRKKIEAWLSDELSVMRDSVHKGLDPEI
ncbi:MAG: hypothetical protein ABFC94_00005, partial [Syntrophomonas sp.]